jgi:hypothetical protein
MQEIANVEGSTTLRKIMAKRVTNKTGSIKVSDDKCTQAEREALEELFRVHLHESSFAADPAHRQGQTSLDTCRIRTNMGD